MGQNALVFVDNNINEYLMFFFKFGMKPKIIVFNVRRFFN